MSRERFESIACGMWSHHRTEIGARSLRNILGRKQRDKRFSFLSDLIGKEKASRGGPCSCNSRCNSLCGGIVHIAIADEIGAQRCRGACKNARGGFGRGGGLSCLCSLQHERMIVTYGAQKWQEKYFSWTSRLKGPCSRHVTKELVTDAICRKVSEII